MATYAVTPLSVEQARTVCWPFKEHKGYQIGRLLDDKVIGLRDLGFAAERAYDWRVREAARTLMMHTLAQAQDTTAGQLNVFTPDRRSFSERRQIQYAMLEGAVMGAALGASAMLVLQTLFTRSQSGTPSQGSLAAINNPLIVITAVIMVLAMLGLMALFLKLLDKAINRIEYQIQLHRKGQRAEERVLNIMYHVLDRRWWLFRNLELPGQRSGDVDFVLVGPSGIWALEVKAFAGEYRNVGDQWQRRLGGRWLSALKNPSRQAKRSAASLSHILRTHDVRQWIQPVVIWSNPESVLQVENPAVFVWQLDQVAHELAGLQSSRPLAEQQVAEIVEILKELYHEPFSSQDE